MAKGYRGSQSKLFRTATEKVDRALKFATAHRLRKKRDFRSLWIVRIGAATKAAGLSYSRFINGLKKLGVELDRKVLSELAIREPKAFLELVTKAKIKLAVS